MTRKSKKRVEVSDDEGGDHGGGSSSAAVATTRPSKLPDDLIPAYDAVVREFTSTMMTRPIFSRYGAIYALCQILERVLPAGARRTELESHVALKHVVASVNDNVRPYGFAIQEARTEGDGKLYYVLANTSSDKMSRGIQCREPWLTAAFQHIVNTVTSNGEGFMRRSTLSGWLKGARLDKPPTPAQLEEGIDRLLLQGWLVEPPGKSSMLTLGARALVELRGQLVALLPDDAKCHACKQVVLMGEQAFFPGAGGESVSRTVHPYCIVDPATKATAAEKDTGVAIKLGFLQADANAKAWGKLQRAAAEELSHACAPTARGSAALHSVAEGGSSSSSSGGGVGAKRRTSGGGGGGRGRGRGRAGGSDVEDSGADEDSDSGCTDSEAEEYHGAGAGAGAGRGGAKKGIRKGKAAAGGAGSAGSGAGAGKGKGKAPATKGKGRGEDNDEDYGGSAGAGAGVGAGAGSAADASADGEADESHLSPTQPRGRAAAGRSRAAAAAAAAGASSDEEGEDAKPAARAGAGAAKRPRLRKAARAEASDTEDD